MSLHLTLIGPYPVGRPPSGGVESVNRALVESLEKLSAEDTALREISERKISYELATADEIAAFRG